MDLKDITKRLEPLLKDDSFVKDVKANPIKAIETKLGFKIPTDLLRQVLEFVKSKVDIGDVSKIIAAATGGGGFLAKLKSLFKK